MDVVEQVSRQRARILERIGLLGAMRMGSVSEQTLARTRADGTRVERGPYATYTFKRGGRTLGKRLVSEREQQLYRRQIDTYRQYQQLSAELVEVSQRLADLEAAGEAGGAKKNSRR